MLAGALFGGVVILGSGGSVGESARAVEQVEALDSGSDSDASRYGAELTEGLGLTEQSANGRTANGGTANGRSGEGSLAAEVTFAAEGQRGNFPFPGTMLPGAARGLQKPQLRLDHSVPIEQPDGVTSSLIIQRRGADPWAVCADGQIYYTQTTGKEVKIWTAPTVAGLATARPVKVWKPSYREREASQHIWAPELHQIDGRWYIYFAADSGRNESHRMFVLESVGGPLGPYNLKGRVALPGEDRWAIDGTVLNWNGELYFAWSGWPGPEDGQQNIYIARMANPWTLTGEVGLISAPEFRWESWINEGPVFLSRGRSLSLIYSANKSWTDHYRLGRLDFSGTNLVDPSNWRKYPKAVFDSVRSGTTPILAPGHCSFLQDEDGADWIFYHVARAPGSGWSREVRAQRFNWSADGIPDLGKPLLPRAANSTSSAARILRRVG